METVINNYLPLAIVLVCRFLRKARMCASGFMAIYKVEESRMGVSRLMHTFLRDSKETSEPAKQ